MSNELVVVVAGGEAPDAGSAQAVPESAPVVAADRGLEHALALGLTVAVAVGEARRTAVAAAACGHQHARRTVVATGRCRR